MRIYIVGCGGAVGPPLIRWILDHSDAVIAGSDDRHERLADLLGVPRFNFYVMNVASDPATAQEFVRRADLVIDLRSLERPPQLSQMAELDEALRTNWLPAVSAASGTRLVYVSNDRVYDRAVVLSDGPRSSPSRRSTAALVEDEAPLLSSQQTDARALLTRTFDALGQQLIHAYGRVQGLDYTIVRVVDALGESLEWVGMPDAGLPSRMHRALRAGIDAEVRAAPEDREVRAFVPVQDVADGIGLVVMDTTGRSSGLAFNIAAPQNISSAVGLAELERQQFRERLWDGASPLPRVVDGQLPAERPLRIPSIDRARRLLGWEPRLSLADAVELALGTLSRTS